MNVRDLKVKKSLTTYRGTIIYIAVVATMILVLQLLEVIKLW